MKQNDPIEEVFNRLKDDFEIAPTPAGHEKRFMDRLNDLNAAKKKSFNWWKPLSIAASIALLVTIGFTTFGTTEQSLDLASVSPEMEQAQSFFTSTINQELEKLKTLQNEDTKKLVDDAMERLEKLEKDYDRLKLDLLESGSDKRVIAAMINNFQSRIDILEHVITTIEDFKTLKEDTHETII